MKKPVFLVILLPLALPVFGCSAQMDNSEAGSLSTPITSQQPISLPELADPEAYTMPIRVPLLLSKPAGEPQPVPEGILPTPTSMPEPTTTSGSTGSTAIPTQDSSAPMIEGTEDILIIGDSLTVGSQAVLESKLEKHNLTHVVDAEVGRTTQEGVDRLLELEKEQEHDMWVIALGTNDWDATSFQTQAKRVLDQSRGRPVLWVNVSREQANSLNKVLENLSEEYSNLTILDWDTMIKEKPEFVAGDQIHLTSQGYEWRAKQIFKTLLGKE